VPTVYGRWRRWTSATCWCQLRWRTHTSYTSFMNTCRRTVPARSWSSPTPASLLFFLHYLSVCILMVILLYRWTWVTWLARDVIYTSRAYAMMSVSVCLWQVHWRIIANLGFKFQSKFTTHCGRGACGHEGRDYRREELRDHLALC